MTFLKTDSARLCNKNEVFIGRRVITAELPNKETEMHSFLSVFVRQILLKNQTKKISSNYTKKKLHKTTVQHKDNKLRRQH